MEGAPLSLILDVVILVLLGLTIVYAARLSLQLRRLRDSKSDLDKIVRELVRNIDKADRAVGALKETAREAGGDLQNAIDRAVSIADELEVVNDSGNRIAAKLETLLDRARPMTAGTNTSAAPVSQVAGQAAGQATGSGKGQDYSQHLRKLDPADERIVEKPVSEKTAAPRNPFSIRDADAERGADPLDQARIDEESQALYSDAERDLFRAMKSRTKA